MGAAAKAHRAQWGPHAWSREEALAIKNARAKGEHWKANLLEAEARGRYVHVRLEQQFPHLNVIS